MRQRRRDLLCIDDDPTGLQVRKVLLESFGFRVMTAGNGPDGLRALNSQHPDAVLLDYQMPGMNGGEVALRIKQLRPETPVLMLSALPMLPEEAPAECIDAFVWKGEPAGRLLAIVERLLAESAAEEAMLRAASPGTALDMAIEKLSVVVERVRRSVTGGLGEEPVNAIRRPKAAARHNARRHPQLQRS